MGAASLPGQGFDELPTEVAILDSQGAIVITNRAWRTFASANGYTGDPTFSGVNYLEVCDAVRHDCEEAALAADGIRRVLSGEDDMFALDYPCHSPTERRWFLMRAVPFRSSSNGQYAVVMHLEITDRRLAEHRVKAQNDRFKMLAYVLSTNLHGPLSEAIAAARQLEQRDEAAGNTLVQTLEQIETLVKTGTALAEADSTIEQVPVTLREQAEVAWERSQNENASFLVVDSRIFLAEPNLLQLLFDVLFSNALEHGGDTARIRVGMTYTGFYVEDDGPGIDPANRERIFESGVVINSTAEREGMGLPIAARIAELHDWSIHAEQSNLGGTRVEVNGIEWV
ncbi:ATP-binding protein [Halogeometricum borinquense]|uniref:histidine kinase n=1 Tax=Halogeometricum borinquense TaxID=60847 RepID=A0A482T908_9EURY|nr:ATP-binding protein [Halogeometricum borinquense]RYJ14364.1 ATP-binding protein [Halogeometricum borinquense]